MHFLMPGERAMMMILDYELLCVTRFISVASLKPRTDFMGEIKSSKRRQLAWLVSGS